MTGNGMKVKHTDDEPIYFDHYGSDSTSWDIRYVKYLNALKNRGDQQYFKHESSLLILQMILVLIDNPNVRNASYTLGRHHQI